jgi:hypothetical protein
MTTDWDGDGTTEYLDHGVQPGLAFYSPDNDFSDWNHVYVPYCSSDGWLGRKTDVHPSKGSAFTIDARGHTILYAVRSMLRKLGSDPNWTAQGYVMPDIDDASEILFSGTSAGGYGALQNGDWFVTPFSARKGLVVDAGIDITDDVLVDDAVWAHTGSGASINQYSHRIELELAKWATGGYYARVDAFVDESCRALYEPMGRLDRCSIPPALLILNGASGPLVATPTFLRLDLEDNTLSDYYTDLVNLDGDSLVIGGASGSAITIDDYATLARATLVELYDDVGSVEAAYGPRCGNHVGLDNLFALAVDTTEDTDVPNGASTLHDALIEWFQPGASSQRVRWIDSDGLPATVTSVCN